VARLLNPGADETAEAATAPVRQAALAFSHMIRAQYQPAVTIQGRIQCGEAFDWIQFGVLYP
jgi:hypothetical protein